MTIQVSYDAATSKAFVGSPILLTVTRCFREALAPRFGSLDDPLLMTRLADIVYTTHGKATVKDTTAAYRTRVANLVTRIGKLREEGVPFFVWMVGGKKDSGYMEAFKCGAILRDPAWGLIQDNRVVLVERGLATPAPARRVRAAPTAAQNARQLFPSSQPAPEEVEEVSSRVRETLVTYYVQAVRSSPSLFTFTPLYRGLGSNFSVAVPYAVCTNPKERNLVISNKPCEVRERCRSLLTLLDRK